jgi:hypothetical protein
MSLTITANALGSGFTYVDALVVGVSISMENMPLAASRLTSRRYDRILC